jgi:hypothetical protein
VIKKIAFVDMTGALATGLFAVAFHLDGTFVVLVEDGFSNRIALCLHEHLDVYGVSIDRTLHYSYVNLGRFGRRLHVTLKMQD